ncbi:MAG: YebC/PmpR family DNA-binding transcriptional regulator [Leptospirales bacterium]
MSGHSKWATTKHKKAAIDAKRGKAFTRLAKEITVAARMGGGDPEGNPRLRTAMLKAREENMPMENIRKAIQRGTGEIPGAHYEDYQFEGHGPKGVAILIKVQTDNKNRTVPEIRTILSKHGGNLGENGCVSWMFDMKGIITLEIPGVDEDKAMEMALDVGAEDVRLHDGGVDLVIAPSDFNAVFESVKGKKWSPTYAEVTMIPQTTVPLDGKDAQMMVRLMETLEDHDDVQNVYANFDIPDTLLDQLIGEGS